MLSRFFGKSIYLPSPGPVLQITAQAFRFLALVTAQVLRLYRCLQIAVCCRLLYPVAVAVYVCCICLRSGLYPVVWPDGLTVWSCHLSLVLFIVACPGLWSGYSPVIWLSGLVTVLHPAAASVSVPVLSCYLVLLSGPAVWSCSCHLVRCSWSDALDLVLLLQT